MIFAEMAIIGKFVISPESETDAQSLTNNGKSNSQLIAACGLLRHTQIPQKRATDIQQLKPASKKER